MSGLYESTGDWMYKAGVPAKSVLRNKKYMPSVKDHASMAGEPSQPTRQSSLREGYPVFSRLSGTQTGNAPGHGEDVYKRQIPWLTASANVLAASAPWEQASCNGISLTHPLEPGGRLR